MIATLILATAVLSLSWWLGIIAMLAAAWPVAMPLAFVLVRLRSGRSPLWWLDMALETLMDMSRDAWPTFAARFRERSEEEG